MCVRWQRHVLSARPYVVACYGMEMEYIYIIYKAYTHVYGSMNEKNAVVQVSYFAITVQMFFIIIVII